MANLFQPKTAVIEYRPALIDGSYKWYWSLLPLPDETHAFAHGDAKSRGAAALEARQKARKHGYKIASVRIKHNFTEAAARRIRTVMENRQRQKPTRIREEGPDDVDPKAALNELPARYWLVSIEAVQAQEVIDYYVIAFDKKDAVERLQKRGVIRPEPEDYVAAVIEVPKSDYDQFLKWQDEFGVYESKEKIVAAASKIRGKVYTGTYHPDAVWNAFAQGAFPEFKTREEFHTAWGKDKIEAPEEGFVTSSGRFVDRNEAFKIAAKAAQIDPEADDLLRGRYELDAGDAYFGESVSDEAAKAEEPTEAQAEAGNYKMGHVTLFGLDISIENAKGSTRSGKGKDGKEWSVTMPAHYGYVKGTEGKDKDHVDVYIGPDEKSEKVYVVNQHHLEGGFDEHKCMICFANRESAITTYDKAFTGDLGPKLRDSVVTTTMEKFKEWLESGDTKKSFKAITEAEDPDSVSPKDYLLGAGPFGWTIVDGQYKVTFNGEPIQWYPDERNATAAASSFNELHKTKPYRGGLTPVDFWYHREKYGRDLAREYSPHYKPARGYRRRRAFESADPDDFDPVAYLKSTPHFTFITSSHMGEQVWLTSDLNKKRGWPQDIGVINRDPDNQWFVVYARGLSGKHFAGKRFATPEDAAMEIWTKQHLRKGNLYTGMFESADPDDVNPSDYLKDTTMPDCPSCGKNDWEWFTSGLKVKSPPRVFRCKSCNLHWRPDMNPAPKIGSMGGCWRPDKPIKRLGEAEDPDSIDPRHYLTTFDWRAAVKRMGFESRVDRWHMEVAYVKEMPPFRIVVEPTARRDNSVGVILYEMVDGVAMVRFHQFIEPTMVEPTISNLIDNPAEPEPVSEAEDPDAVNPRDYFNRTFPVKVSMVDFVWALEYIDARAVGVRREGEVWYVYGHIYTSRAGVKNAIKSVINKFGLKADYVFSHPSRDDNDELHPSEEDSEEFQRRFSLYIPLHEISPPTPDDMFPIGSHVRIN